MCPLEWYISLFFNVGLPTNHPRVVTYRWMLPYVDVVINIPNRHITQQWRRYYVKTTSFWRNYVKMTSFCRNNDVIITSCVQGVVTLDIGYSGIHSITTLVVAAAVTLPWEYFFQWRAPHLSVASHERICCQPVIWARGSMKSFHGTFGPY